MRLGELLKKDKKLAIGIMSGTSLDGIDVCLVEIEGSGIKTKVNLIDFLTEGYVQAEQDMILDLCSPETSNVADICRANVLLGKKFGFSAKKLMIRNGLTHRDVDFISSHGQTIYHMPEDNATLQIGELAEIATITGCITIGDYRPSDMAVGGQGAPLVPYTDYVLFSDKDKGRILMNIGGISNLSALKADCDEDDILAFDCGPGNMLIDRAVTILSNNEITYDKDGEIALSGNICEPLLKRLIDCDDFVLAKPPKSTGREQYNEVMVKRLLKFKVDYELSIEDFVATVTAYTYVSIAENIKKFVLNNIDIREIYIGGGGAKNKAILKGLRANIDIDVYTMEDMKFSSDAKESIAFAIMGNEFLNARSNNLKTATGAKHSVVMGKLVYPPII